MFPSPAQCCAVRRTTNSPQHPPLHCSQGLSPTPQFVLATAPPLLEASLSLLHVKQFRLQGTITSTCVAVHSLGVSARFVIRSIEVHSPAALVALDLWCIGILSSRHTPCHFGVAASKQREGQRHRKACRVAWISKGDIFQWDAGRQLERGWQSLPSVVVIGLICAIMLSERWWRCLDIALVGLFSAFQV